MERPSGSPLLFGEGLRAEHPQVGRALVRIEGSSEGRRGLAAVRN